MRTKTVYLHDNGELVIWGLSEFFEPSHLVKEQFRIEESVADSEDFRRIVDLYNTRVHEKSLLLKRIDIADSDYKTVMNIAVKRDAKLQRIKNLSFWQRLFKRNILDIIGKEKE